MISAGMGWAQVLSGPEMPKEIPPKVEYRLTKRGKLLIPILDGMCEWSDRNRV